MYVLEATNGPLDGKRWLFEHSIEIGRDGSLAASLAVDSAASRRHARVEADETGVRVIDLGSSNGTIVDGSAIAATSTLAFAQPFIVGRTRLRVLEIQGE